MRCGIQDINDALARLGLNPIDFLPQVGWDAKLEASGGAGGGGAAKGIASPELGRERIDKMGKFLSDTRELHKFFLERLQGVKDEKRDELGPIEGVLASPLLPLDAACK